jgi:hypothetical protein
MYSPRVSFAGSGTGASAAEIWEYELLPGVTAGDMLIAIYQSNCWSELTSANNTPGTFGKLVQDTLKQVKLSVGLSA